MFTQFRLARAVCFAGALLTLGGGAIGLTGGTSFAAGVGPGSTVAVNNAPYSSAGKSCDPTRDGWHFVMNQLEYPVGAVIDGNDFGPITITFSDGTSAVATFTDLSGGTTAHFLNSTVNQAGSFTVSSAAMTFPAGTDITGYGNFVISHPPCGTVATTTTTTLSPSTTTALTPTTAAAAPTLNTTLVAPTTTNLAQSGAPVPATTTTITTAVVRSAAPVSPTSASPAAGQLPSTGNDAGRLVLVGGGLFGLGLTLMRLTRRPRPVNG